ncbi:NAD(P)-binding protein [Teratosphaeria nubilosa]|uniref:NAD(P)-binding protein n=1 Tax=Teratosphaeria nubilosa TaxID=161662 RepID=A0A6G1KYA8_9PEZI|nr:NAD(P)-binding protein [Teratosphaeria nubilosa]
MPPTHVFRPSANALITGAASGIGLAVAKLCASYSMNLFLVDINSNALTEAKYTISQIPKSGNVEIVHADVSKLEDWNALKSQVEGRMGKLDFLHLNAGIGLKGEWTDSAYFHKIFDVNFFGVVNGINTFFPHFHSSSSSQKAIIITGSKQGITNPPGNPAYNASKSAIKTIAEHLSFDLAKTKTSVHLLVPGWTFTGLTGKNTKPDGVETANKTKPDGAWAPEQVAEYLYKKMEEDKFYIICPDNDVDWETDRKRMMWTMGDVVFERMPQSRWREEYKEEAEKTMERMELKERQIE